jgi:hypothetical protein
MTNMTRYLCSTLLVLPSLAYSNPIEFSGLLEIEARSEKSYEGSSANEIVMATAEIAAEAELNETANVFVTLFYEEGLTPLEVDQAFLNYELGQGFFVKGGQVYMPSGNFATQQISDPLTLELAEIRDSSIELGYANKTIQVSAYAFNGNVDKDDDDNQVSEFGATVNLALLEDQLKFGARYISNLLGSFLIAEQFVTPEDEDPFFHDAVAGFSFSIDFQIGPVTLAGEIVQLLDTIHYAENQYDSEAANIEAGYDFGSGYSFAVAYQTTEDCLWLGLPENALSATFAKTLIEDRLSFGFEVRQNNDYGISDGGTDKSANVVTLQLAATF